MDYESAVARVIDCAQRRQRCTTSALAVHGVITGALDRAHRFRLNALDLVVPDGQPVRWALNSLHKLGLSDRVYGPRLALMVCQKAAREGVPVYFYGTSDSVLQQLSQRLGHLCPGLKIAGAQPSRFRKLTGQEKAELVETVKASGARILFVGLGCPRQEVFTYEMSEHLEMPILAIGAAFEYYAGIRSEPPEFIQRAGLQWLYRLFQEPRRLFRRYLVTNTQFVALFVMQKLRLWSPDPSDAERPSGEMLHG